MEIDMACIEKGIALPARGRPPSGRFPFAKMQIGDSFVVENADVPNVRVYAHLFGVKSGTMKFSVRKAEGGEYRCWRVS
jgi:hypothetical protein